MKCEFTTAVIGDKRTMMQGENICIDNVTTSDLIDWICAATGWIHDEEAKHVTTVNTRQRIDPKRAATYPTLQIGSIYDYYDLYEVHRALFLEHASAYVNAMHPGAVYNPAEMMRNY